MTKFYKFFVFYYNDYGDHMIWRYYASNHCLKNLRYDICISMSTIIYFPFVIDTRIKIQ